MSEVSRQKPGFRRGHALAPLLFALSFCGAVLLALCVPAEAQQPKKVSRIGYLTNAPLSVNELAEAFQQGLRQLGYVEGNNIFIEWRWTASDPRR